MGVYRKRKNKIEEGGVPWKDKRNETEFKSFRYAMAMVFIEKGKTI